MIDNYAEFAVFYDETTTTDIPGRVALITSLIKKHTNNPHNLLEIGCGTGTILELFQEDYNLTGLDLSPPMLKIAKIKVPTATFITGDMATFELNQTYDVILCMFDSINHLLYFRDWDRTFERVSVHLAKGGIFIFDFNTLTKLKLRAASEPVATYVKDLWVVANMQKRGRNVYEWQIEIDGQPIIVPEAAFSIEKIEKAASKYFTIKEKLTDDRSSVSESAMRIYFACQKE